MQKNAKNTRVYSTSNPLCFHVKMEELRNEPARKLLLFKPAVLRHYRGSALRLGGQVRALGKHSVASPQHVCA